MRLLPPLRAWGAIWADNSSLPQDWGSTPSVIENCLDVADEYDVQVNIHTDTLNESGFVESKSLSSIKVLPYIINLVKVPSKPSAEELSILITRRELVCIFGKPYHNWCVE
jgi:hypothetical protein